MRSAKSYIKDIGDFLNKLKDLGSVTKSALLVTIDVVGYIQVYLIRMIWMHCL